ncbi:MAG: pilus assembly protein TadG-related protein [Candidatus Zixiibacteriota bacterium]
MEAAIRKFYRDERGNVIVLVGALLALLLVFSVYAIDTSQMLLVRTQLQNAADAGALNGALEFALTGDSANAIDAAILAAGANEALIQSGDANIMGPVTISAADIEFPDPGIIRVTTHRTAATGDNFLNYFMRIFADDGEIGEMTARAAAGHFWVCGGTCVKPWAPPDRWVDVDGNGLFNAGGADTLDYYDPIATGYTDADLGTQVTLVLGNGNKDDFGQFWYYSIDFPPINKPEFGDPIPGANEYEAWICEECHDDRFTVGPGDLVQVEPGKMVGPNSSGLDCLIQRDSLAEWHEPTGKVINSAFPVSPRIVKAALFDPREGLKTDLNGRKYLVITKIMVIFIESTAQNNQQITGRFMRLADPDGEICEDQSNPSFLFKTALVE